MMWLLKSTLRRRLTTKGILVLAQKPLNRCFAMHVWQNENENENQNAVRALYYSSQHQPTLRDFTQTQRPGLLGEDDEFTQFLIVITVV